MCESLDTRYQIFKVEFEGTPNNHPAIFVQREIHLKYALGDLIHVTGAIELKDGMKHEFKKDYKLWSGENCRYLAKEHIGYIKPDEESVAKLKKFAEALPAPPCQFDKNGPKTHSLRRCNEWMADYEKKIYSGNVLDGWNPDYKKRIMESLNN